MGGGSTLRTRPPVQGHRTQLEAEGSRPASHASHSHFPSGTALSPWQCTCTAAWQPSPSHSRIGFLHPCWQRSMLLKDPGMQLDPSGIMRPLQQLSHRLTTPYICAYICALEKWSCHIVEPLRARQQPSSGRTHRMVSGMAAKQAELQHSYDVSGRS